LRLLILDQTQIRNEFTINGALKIFHSGKKEVIKR